jgi:hypothetical protein
MACESCKFWHRHIYVREVGTCTRLKSVLDIEFCDETEDRSAYVNTISTGKSFGCVEHKQEETPEAR